MTNGQLNIASVQTVTQLVTQEPTVSVTVTMDGVEQNGGVFAGLLSGVQLPAKEKDLPDSGQAEQFLSRTGKHQLPPDSGAESSVVDLLARLHVSPPITNVSEPAATKPGDPEKTDVCADAVPVSSELSDVTSQMALAAYLQPGRMPEVNIPTPLSIDMLQNVATVTEQPAVISASPLRIHTDKVAAEPIEAQSLKPSVTLAKEPVAYFAAEQIQHHQPETVRSTAVDRQLDTIVASEPAPQRAVQPELSDRMSEVNNPSALPVDRLQNVATPAASEQPAIFSASLEKVQVEQTTAEPVRSTKLQTPVTPSATTPTVPAPDEHIVLQGTRTADLPAIPDEKPAAASITLQSELPSDHPTAPVLADHRSAEVVQEMRGVRQRLNPEQQIEKVRTGNEQSVVKEMTQSLQAAASVNETTLGSDTSGSSDSNQKQPDIASDNQMLEQLMPGHLKTEQQRVAALSTKAAPTEPLRQDIPEQVMQQVKERLVQHDVKPGSQQITLTLSPENLGELKINLNLQGQKLSVEIVTENRTVRDAIVQHTDALKESLARQNITMESFDVTTGGKGSGNQGQNQSAWRELAKQQQQQHWTSPRGYHTAQADLPSGQAAYQRQRGDSMLDIHY